MSTYMYMYIPKYMPTLNSTSRSEYQLEGKKPRSNYTQRHTDRILNATLYHVFERKINIHTH